MMHPIEQQSAPLARQEKLIVRELSGEVMVYDLTSHKAHCLNKAAAVIWEHCDGQTAANEIAALMEQEQQQPIGEDVVWLALQQLDKAKLLQEPLVSSKQGMKFSRRAALRKLGLTTAASLPLVVSVIAPTAATAATVPPIPPICRVCAIFGSGSGRSNTCPPVCGPTAIGLCFNNSSCMGVGGALPPSSCPDCYNFNPTSSSWRV